MKHRLSYDYTNKQSNMNDFINYMLDRTLSMFEYENLPDTIPAIELERLLQVNGFAVFYEHDNDLYAFTSGFSGQDVYNNYTHALINNPALNLNVETELDVESVLMLNDDTQQGLLPLLQRYAYLLTENDITMVLANVNKRIQTLISASDDATIESAKDYLKKIEKGELGIVATSKMFDSLQVQGQQTVNTNMTDLFEYQQYLKGSLFNEIGLSASFNMKRERLTSAETELNDDSLYSLVNNFLKNRKQAIDQVNEVFGTDISVEFSELWKKHEVEIMNAIGEPTDEPTEPVDEPTDPVDPVEPDDPVEEVIDQVEELIEEVEELDEPTDPVVDELEQAKEGLKDVETETDNL